MSLEIRIFLPVIFLIYSYTVILRSPAVGQKGLASKPHAVGDMSHSSSSLTLHLNKPSQYSTMRLLNVHTFKLHEFIGNDIPPYAILSHRWEDEEVTFQALQAGHGPGMKGWKKIEGCCRQAVADHFVYVVSLKYEIYLTSCLSKSC
jgi:hypothetical protein